MKSLNLKQLYRQRIIAIQPLVPSLSLVAIGECLTKLSLIAHVEQGAICSGAADDARRTFDPVALVKPKGIHLLISEAEGTRQNGAVFDGHRGALCKIRQSRVNGVAQHRRAPRAPLRNRRAVVERPAIAHLPVGTVDDRLN